MVSTATASSSSSKDTTTTTSPCKTNSTCGAANKACLESSNDNKCVSNCAGYGRVCPVYARKAASAACHAVEKLSKDSQVFKEPCSTKIKAISHWSLEELTIGEKLGAGGFSEVHKVFRTSEPSQVYAIKYLKRQVMVHPRAFELGAADLAVEGYFLASLNHPNIVKLHALTAGSVEDNVMTGKECCLFIVIDYLNITLENQIEVWREELNDNKRRSTSLLPVVSAEIKAKRHLALMDRLGVAREICTAMQYLHGLNIIYRDLKPDNVGFDKDGVVKLFDFGLAKELLDNQKTDSGKYRLTGKTGSRRYMAPEVANDLPYDKSVDVFSFGILLWEICAMEKPFFGYSSGKHQKQVVLGDERPKPDPSWPMELQWLMKRCWNRQANHRPAFEEVHECLDEIIIISGDKKKKKKEFVKPDRLRGISNDEAPIPNFANMMKAAKPQGRARTWGFPARKQVAKNES